MVWWGAFPNPFPMQEDFRPEISNSLFSGLLSASIFCPEIYKMHISGLYHYSSPAQSRRRWIGQLFDGEGAPPFATPPRDFSTAAPPTFSPAYPKSPLPPSCQSCNLVKSAILPFRSPQTPFS
jgi:hypothetical protein